MDNVPETAQALTSYADTTAHVSGTVPQLMADIQKPIVDPYPEQMLNTLLTRSYRILSFSWASLDVQGTNLAVIQMPNALTALPFMIDKLKDFTFLRTDVCLSIRINSTAFNYGRLLVSYLPFYRHLSTKANRHGSIGGGAPATAGFWQRALNNAMVMSANSATTLEFTIPWMVPTAGINLNSISSNGGILASIFIDVLNPLLSGSSAAPTDVEVSVFANFCNLKVWGMLPGNVVALREGALREKLHPQSNKEAAAKSEKGVISSVLETAGTVSTVLSAVPVIGEIASIAAPILKIAAAGAKAFGLNKPTTEETMKRMAVMPYADMPGGKGMDYGTKMALSLDTELPVEPGIVDGNDPQPSMNAILRHPALIATGSFDNTAVTDDVLTRWWVETTIAPSAGGYFFPGPLAYYAMVHEFWRGSLKYHIQFSTSKFTSARVRIGHLPSNEGAVAGSLAAYSGDYVSRVVDILGDTEVSFTVPWNQHQYWHQNFSMSNFPGDQGFSNGEVVISLVNKVVNVQTTGSNIIYWNVWVSAGEDFQFNFFRGWVSTVSIPFIPDSTDVPDPVSDREREAYVKELKARVTGQKFEPQSIMKAVFEEVMDPLIDATFSMEHGFIKTDFHEKFTDLLHRYTYPHITGLGPSTQAYLVTDNVAGRSMNSWLMAPFMFYRGSWRYKIFWTSATPGLKFMHLTPNTGTVPQFPLTVVTGVGEPGVLQSTVPWYDIYPFRETTNTFAVTTPIKVFLDGPAQKGFYESAGDDISVFMLTAPPPVIEPPPLEKLAKKINFSSEPVKV